MKTRSGPVPERVLAVLPALAAVAAFAFLSGIPSCRDIRGAQERASQLGDPEEHELQSMALRRRIDDANAELAALRAPESRPRQPGGAAGFGPVSPAVALGEAHRRILGHGAHILRVTPVDRDASGGDAPGDEALRLLRLQTGHAPRSGTGSVEAPWGAIQSLLDDAAAETNAPVAALVQSLTMQPAVGAGRPGCWSFTISQ